MKAAKKQPLEAAARNGRADVGRSIRRSHNTGSGCVTGNKEPVAGIKPCPPRQTQDMNNDRR